MFSYTRMLHPSSAIAVLVLVIISFAFSTPASAAVIFQQPAISSGEGVFSNAAAGAQNADSFAVASAVDIRTISWWGSYDGDTTDSFNLRVYADASGTPGTTLLNLTGVTVTKTAAGFNDTAGAPVSRYVASLATPLSLTPGTYYLAVTNETQTAQWYWLAGTGTGTNSTHWQRTSDAASWNVSSTPISLALALDDASSPAVAVPLPPISLLFMALGLAGVALYRRSKVVNSESGEEP